jgi:hypothetical protein
MGEQELVFEFLEMKRISYQCQQCKTVVVFDVTLTETAVPDRCPCCNIIPVGSIIQRSLNLYRNLYQEVLKSSKQFTLQFRVTPPSIEGNQRKG